MVFIRKHKKIKIATRLALKVEQGNTNTSRDFLISEKKKICDGSCDSRGWKYVRGKDCRCYYLLFEHANSHLP